MVVRLFGQTVEQMAPKKCGAKYTKQRAENQSVRAENQSHLVVDRVLRQKALPHATIYMVEAASVVYKPV